jgi:hypothetical protein
MFKDFFILCAGLIIAFLLFSTLIAADTQSAGTELPKGLQGISIGGTYYLSYQAGQEANGARNYNRFSVNRGYLTVKKTINPLISARITLDTYQDNNSGNSKGSFVVRLKYLYAQFNLPSGAFFTEPIVEIGMAHTPWLDFEEKLNPYRMQGTMFVERAGVFGSADLGFTFVTLLGGKISDDYQKRVSNGFPGRYGSFAWGLYNGGGYNAFENNQSKVAQARLTIRPLPDVIPGLQASYFGTFGRSNQSSQEDVSNDTTGESDISKWNTSILMLSYEMPILTLTGQIVTGKGNQKGDWAEEVNYQGYSFFANLKLVKHWKGMVRYDVFDPNTDNDDDAYNRMIIGGGYDFGGGNILLVDYDIKNYQDTSKDPDPRFSINMQINY